MCQDSNDKCCHSCCENNQYTISEEDLLDIRKDGVFTKKHDGFVKTVYFIWGACFGALISTVIVYFN